MDVLCGFFTEKLPLFIRRLTAVIQHDYYGTHVHSRTDYSPRKLWSLVAP